MEQRVSNTPSSLRNARLVSPNLVVVDPMELKECVMKAGSMKDLYVCDDKDSYSQCMCVVADEAGSMPYEIDKRIKEAICGDVYTGFKLQAVDNDNKYKRKEMIVIKVISFQKIAQIKQSSKMQEDPMKEIAILQKFDAMSANVCDQIDCIRDDKYIYSIMSHYGEELFNHAGKLSEDETRDYFSQIINGVRTLQMFDVCHRDLSLENILVSPEGVCTIIDFGMSLVYPTANESTFNTLFNQLSNSNNEKVVPSSCCTTKDVTFNNNDAKRTILMPPQGTCGKKNYIAPEILTNLDPFNGAMVDNWALGVILFMLLTGRPPFHRASMLDKWYRMIQQEKLREMLSLWKVEGLSEGAVDLLQKLLKGSNPSNRMTTGDILLHPWFSPESVPPSNAEDSIQC